MFHLFTHAFFKALLFLGAGAIIHAVHTNDVLKMGNLRKFMPITHITFLVACLAISGLPPFSGFFSKEEILWATWQQHRLIFGIALITAGLTAFYMFRLYFLVFWNNSRTEWTHKSEAPVLMKWPLMLLAFISLLAGFIPFGQFVGADGREVHPHLPLLFSAVPLAVSLLGIALAYRLYQSENTLSTQISTRFQRIYRWSYHAFFINELYRFITLRIIFPFIGRPAAWADKHVVNGSINAIGNGTEKVAHTLRRWQSGKVQQYAFYFFAGVCLLSLLLIYRWK
jgi:NADH-quinone oxidoreductase subunit L